MIARPPAMRRLGQRDLDAYMADDWIGELLRESAIDGDETLVCQRWLAEVPAKRLIFAELYGDLLKRDGLRVLDVGGGLTSLTRRLASGHDYDLIDFMAHDPSATVKKFVESVTGLTVYEADWSEINLVVPYDIVLANDLFTNVDQRLSMFLDRVLPICREARLSLTYYSESRFYRAKRVDADEILSVLAWTGSMTRLALVPFASRVYEFDSGALDAKEDSIFPNRRQICLVTLKGDQTAI